jgi:hypothetical protein
MAEAMKSLKWFSKNRTTAGETCFRTNTRSIYKTAYIETIQMGIQIDLEMSMGSSCSSLLYSRRNPVFLSVFLYGCFCMSSAIIPESINYGPSLCFAYVFSMIQMLEVSTFMQSESVLGFGLMCMTLFSASVIPTMQIYQVMTGDYSKELGEVYSYIYMGKEIILHVAMKYRGVKSVSFSVAHSFLVLFVWGLTEFLFFILISDELISGYENIVCIARLTPQFYLAALTLIHSN